MSIKTSFKELTSRDNKIGGIIYFMGVIIITHVLWKILINGDENGHQVAFAGIDVTSFFYKISLFTTEIAWWTLNNIFMQDFKLNGVEIILKGTQSVTIIWACSAVKQLYMFICLILFFPHASWKKKILYALFGCLILEIFNIIRIDIVAFGSSMNMNNFDFLHKITQYGFYVVMFLLWIYWEEKVVNKKN